MTSSSPRPAATTTTTTVKPEQQHPSKQLQSEARISQVPPPTQAHTRTYQACLPCRNRKVRCDLGPVDNPHDPPCQRCRREQKDCIFSATRRKRNPNDGEDVDVVGDDGYEIRNARKRTRTGSDDRLPEGTSAKPLTPKDSLAQSKISKGSVHGSSDEDDSVVNNDTTAILQQTEVFDGRDALNLLFEAADARGDITRNRSQSSGTAQRPALAGDAVTTPQSGFGSRPMARGPSTTSARAENTPGNTSAAALDQNSVFTSSVEDVTSEGMQDAIDAWSSLRFVKANLFTATEGIGFIDYFYRFLSPMTPVTVPDYHNPTKHRKLLCDEPMLAMTMLTIASRYVFPPGPGSSSRGIAIHDRLWVYLQGMIDRMIWGQEQFGFSFTSVGANSSGAIDGKQPRGLRTLGTIESLLLLTEWHTRALHFPPGDDTDELIPPSEKAPGNIHDREASGDGLKPPPRRRIDSWLDPISRSDRMSWSLLSNALALAYELGIYDKDAEGEAGSPAPSQNLSKTQRAARRRYKNIRSLLFVYVTQISGRLNLPTMLPDDHRGTYTPDLSIVELVKSSTQQERVSKSDERSERVQDVVLYFWCRLSQIMKDGNRELFPTRTHTRQLISTGKYAEYLEKFSKLLKDWYDEFDACTIIPTHMRHILNIEFEYNRVYCHSLSLQAVVERCTNNTPTRPHARLVKSASSGAVPTLSKGQNDTIPPTTLVKWLDGDRKYIRVIVQASQNLLRSIVEGLLPGDYLKHASVRTYFRIISVSMFLLKTFALGATEDDAAISLSLFDKAAMALRTCIVDDIHIGSRIAELLGTLTHRVRANLIRIAASGTKSNSGSQPETRSASHSNSRAASPGLENSTRARGQVNREGKVNARSASHTSGGPGPNDINLAALPNHRAILDPPKYLQNQERWQKANHRNSSNPTSAQNYGMPAAYNNNIGGNSYPQLQPQSMSPFMSRSGLNMSTNNGTDNNQTFFSSTSNDPLYGISAYDYDPENPAFSIMPPPSFNTSGMHDGSVFNSPTFSGSGASGNANTPGPGSFTAVNTFTSSPTGMDNSRHSQHSQHSQHSHQHQQQQQQQGSDWLALPLDPILNIYGADVTQGGYGPELGGTDMLDLLLTSDNQFYNGAGSNSITSSAGPGTH